MNPIMLSQVSASGEKISIGDAAVTAIFGYCVVFVLENIAKKVEENPLTIVPAEAKKAPGSAGKIKLHSVPDKEAAMIMAIVADAMQKPINELHFISIKEVED